MLGSKAALVTFHFRSAKIEVYIFITQQVPCFKYTKMPIFINVT